MVGTHYIISDLHLNPAQPGVVELYRTFLQRDVAAAQSLTIAGDFLEVFFGASQLAEEFTLGILGELRQLAKQLDLRYVGGNRDFLLVGLAKRWMHATHDRWLDLSDQRAATAVCHGDTLCTRDVGYLRLRRVLRALPLLTLSRILPASVGRAIAGKLRSSSEKKHRRVPYAYNPKYDIQDPAVERLFRSTGASTLIAGHIHRPQVREYSGGRRLLVMSDWCPERAVIARALPGEDFQLVTLTPQGILPFDPARDGWKPESEKAEAP